MRSLLLLGVLLCLPVGVFAAVVPEDDFFVVNLADDGVLRFRVQHMVGGSLSDAQGGSWQLFRGGSLLERGELIREREGVYLFYSDFSYLVTGEYSLLLVIGGVGEEVVVRVVDVSDDWSWFVDGRGSVRSGAVLLLVGFLLLFGWVSVMFFGHLRGGRRAR
jgi:hypothetical protein